MAAESVLAQRRDVPLLVSEQHPHTGNDIRTVADCEVDNSFGVHDISGAVMLVACIGNSILLTPDFCNCILNCTCFFRDSIFILNYSILM